MTREEAREALSVLKIFDAPLLREAVDMAIEALRAEPQGDLISRADAIERFCECGTSLERQGKTIITMVDAKYAFIETLESLPSAEAETVDCTEFIRWLTETVMDDGMWELNAVAYGEVIARKLTKLGVLEVKDDVYVYEPSAFMRMEINKR